MTKSTKDEIEKIVHDAMQSGFDSAMAGTPLNTDDENEKLQLKLYHQGIAETTQALTDLIERDYISKDQVETIVFEEDDYILTYRGNKIYSQAQVDDLIDKKVREAYNKGWNDCNEKSPEDVNKLVVEARIDELTSYPMNWALNRKELVWQKMILSRLNELKVEEDG